MLYLCNTLLVKYAMLNRIKEVVFIGTIDEICDIYCDKTSWSGVKKNIVISADRFKETGKKRFVLIRRNTNVAFAYEDDIRIKSCINDYIKNPDKKDFRSQHRTRKKSGV